MLQLPLRIIPVAFLLTAILPAQAVPAITLLPIMPLLLLVGVQMQLQVITGFYETPGEVPGVKVVI
jgi:hypothetical protein